MENSGCLLAVRLLEFCGFRLLLVKEIRVLDLGVSSLSEASSVGDFGLGGVDSGVISMAAVPPLSLLVLGLSFAPDAGGFGGGPVSLPMVFASYLYVRICK